MPTPPDADDRNPIQTYHVSVALFPFSADPVTPMFATMRKKADELIRAASMPPVTPTDDSGAPEPEALAAWLGALESARRSAVLPFAPCLSAINPELVVCDVLGDAPAAWNRPFWPLEARTVYSDPPRTTPPIPDSPAVRRATWLAARVRALAMACEILHRVERFEKATIPAITLDGNHAVVKQAGLPIPIFDDELPGDAADLLREFKTHREARKQQSGAHRQAKKRLLDAIPALAPFIVVVTTRGDDIAYRWDGPEIS